MSGATVTTFAEFLRRAGAKAIDDDVVCAVQDELDVRFFQRDGEINYGVRGDLTVSHKGGVTRFIWRFNANSWYIKDGVVEATKQDDLLALVATVVTAHAEDGIEDQSTEVHSCSLAC